MPSPPTNAQLGLAVRTLRKARGLSLEELAPRAGIHWTYLSGIERGRKNPSWKVVGSLAEQLDVGVDDLARLAAEQGS